MKKVLRRFIEVLLITGVFCAVAFPMTHFFKKAVFNGYYDYMIGCAEKIRDVFEVESEMLDTIEKTGKSLFEPKEGKSGEEKDEITFSEKAEISGANSSEELISINTDNSYIIVDPDGNPVSWSSDSLSESSIRKIANTVKKEAGNTAFNVKIGIDGSDVVNADGFRLSDNSYFAKVCPDSTGKVSFNYPAIFTGLLTAEKSDPDSFDIICMDTSGSGEFDSNDFYAWNKCDKNGNLETNVDAKGLVLKDNWYGQCTVNGTAFFAAVRISDNGLCFVHVVSAEKMMNNLHILIPLIALTTLGLALAIRLFAKKVTVQNILQGVKHKQVRLSFAGVDKTVASRIIPVVLAGVAILLVFMLLMQSLTGNLDVIENNNSKLESVKNIHSTNRELQKELYKQINTKVLSEIDAIEGVFREKPDMINRESLSGISRTMGFEYMMKFDQWGMLECTDSPYRSLRLEEISANQEFTVLLQGKEPVIAESSISGSADKKGRSTEAHVLFGKCLRDSKDDLIGALVVCVKEEFIDAADELSMIVSAITGKGTDSLIVDPESKIVEASSVDSLAGTGAVECGIKEEQLVSGYRGLLNIKGKKGIASSGTVDNKLIFFSTGNTIDWPLLVIAVLFFSIVLFISFFQLIFIPKDKVEEEEKEQEHDGRFRGKHYSINEYLYGTIVERTHHKDRHAQKMKEDMENKPWLVTLGLSRKGILSVFFIVLILLAYFFYFSRGEYIYFIGQWSKSVNIISISHCVVIMTMVMVVAIVLRMILLLISYMVNQRASTICHLLRSCTSYVAGIIGILLCLDALGVDTGKILAAMGILGLVAGLGAQKLIGDLIAGVFIIFEGVIRVGDIVMVNDSYGIVMEIGMRTIRIVNKAGEISAINNSMIKKLTNLSKYNSSVYITYTIPASVDIDKVENIMREELALVASEHRLPDAIWGPIYMGVNRMTEKGIELTVLAACDEDRVASTRRKLNREVKHIFEKHGIPMAVFYFKDGFTANEDDHSTDTDNDPEE